MIGFGVLERRHNFGIDVSKYLGLNFKLKYCGFFLRFSFDEDVILGLQFVIGLLITS